MAPLIKTSPKKKAVLARKRVVAWDDDSSDEASAVPAPKPSVLHRKPLLHIPKKRKPSDDDSDEAEEKAPSLKKRPHAESSAGKKSGYRQCNVCDKRLMTSNSPKRTPSRTCEHEVETCTGCTQAWVATKIEEGAWKAIPCPSCPKVLEHADVRKAAEWDVYQRSVLR